MRKKEEFLKELRDFYKKIWTCQNLEDCRSGFPKNFYQRGQYCQIPYVCKDWCNNIDEFKIKKNIPNQLFVAYNPRLGFDDKNKNYCINVRSYAEEILSCDFSKPFPIDFDKKHYDYQIAGLDDDKGRHWWGFLENEIWNGVTYKFGIQKLLQEILGVNESTKTSHEIAFFNLIPCSGKLMNDTPSAKIKKNCRGMHFLGQLIKILCPDVIWFLGRNVYDLAWMWLEEENISMSKKFEKNKWGWVLEYNGEKSIVLGMPHPTASNFKYLGENFTSVRKGLEIYKEIFVGWKDNLNNIPHFLEKKLR